MSDTKSSLDTISQALADFSSKFARFKAGASENELRQASVKIESPLKTIQNQINERESERAALLRRQFLEYACPITSDIEEDEESLLKAYKLYSQLVELNNTAGDATTHLRDFSLTSPLCRKSEYNGNVDGLFSFLRLWFIATNPDALFMPVIEQDANGSCYLSFVEKDIWKPTLLEKEIMQVVGE